MCDCRVLDAGAADPGELQREAQQPGGDEDQRTQWADREVGQFEHQGEEKQDGGDDGEPGASLVDPVAWYAGRAISVGCG